MQYGICTLGFISVWLEPSEKSEMITQILLGEHFTITQKFMGWYQAKLAFDQTEGWINPLEATAISARKFQQIDNKPAAVCTSIIDMVAHGETQLTLVGGSSLPLWKPYKKAFSLGKQHSAFNGEYQIMPVKDLPHFLIQHALKYLHTPHLAGGRTPFGIDASGLVQVVFKMAGIRLPRIAPEQVKHGEVLSFMEESRDGDLAFFQDELGEINHVGFIWKKNRVIHVSEKVRIDGIDQYGIYQLENKRYTHQLRVIKRIANAEE